MKTYDATFRIGLVHYPANGQILLPSETLRVSADTEMSAWEKVQDYVKAKHSVDRDNGVRIYSVSLVEVVW